MELPAATIPGARPPRRHRALTLPAGGVLAMCLFLPSYADCGEVRSTRDVPVLAAIAIFGAVFALCGALVRGARREALIATFGAALVFGQGALTGVLALLGTPLVGLDLEVAALAWLFVGAVLWSREADDRDPAETAPARWRARRQTSTILGTIAIASYAAIAAIAPRRPPPPPPPPTTVVAAPAEGDPTAAPPPTGLREDHPLVQLLRAFADQPR